MRHVSDQFFKGAFPQKNLYGHTVSRISATRIKISSQMKPGERENLFCISHLLLQRPFSSFSPPRPCRQAVPWRNPTSYNRSNSTGAMEKQCGKSPFDCRSGGGGAKEEEEQKGTESEKCLQYKMKVLWDEQQIYMCFLVVFFLELLFFFFWNAQTRYKF